MDIHGIDTISRLVGKLPAKITIPYELMKATEIGRQGWNMCFIAIIPFCFKCKVALIWHTPPNQDELFTCPDCNSVWVKGEGWDDKAKADTKDTRTTG